MKPLRPIDVIFIVCILGMFVFCVWTAEQISELTQLVLLLAKNLSSLISGFAGAFKS